MVALAATRTAVAPTDTIVQSQIVVVAIVGSTAYSPTNRQRRFGLKLPVRGPPRGVISVGVRVPLLYVVALLVRVGHRGLVHVHDHDRDRDHHDHEHDRDRAPAHGDTAAGDHRALSRAHGYP